MDVFVVRCLRCGQYEVTGSAQAILAGLHGQGQIKRRQVANISGWLRERPGHLISELDYAALLDLATPTVGERAEKLLAHLEREHPDPGTPIVLDLREPELLGIAWAADESELRFLLRRFLADATQYITLLQETQGPQQSVLISPKGWAFLDSLRRPNPESETGFIAMWFHESTRELRELGIKPAITLAGFRPLPIDEKRHNNPIDAEILTTIRGSRFVVADVHGARGGVYFEAGYARGLNIPVFWTCHAQQLKLPTVDPNAIHFDIRQNVFTPWGDKDWRSFANELAALIKLNVVRGAKSPL